MSLGQTIKVRGGAGLTSARFTLAAGQTVTSGNAILWATLADNTQSWDEIGLGSDFTTTGNLFFPAGTYEWILYLKIGAATAFSTGTGELSFVTSDSFDEKVSTQLSLDTTTAMSVSAGRRVGADFQMNAQIRLIGADDSATLDEGSLFILKVA